MSLRDFNSSAEDRPIILNNEPMGNGAGLGAFHTVNPEDREPNNTPKIIGALAVALMVGAAGAYVYSVSGKSMQPAAVQTASNIPTPAPLPPASQPVADTTAAAPTADATTAMSTPAPTPAPEVKEVKSASTKPVSTKRTASADLGASSARMAADTSQPAPSSTAQPVTAPQQTAAIPEPVSPTASPSDIASNAPVSQPAAAPTAVTPTVEQAPASTPEQPAATPAPAAAAPAAEPAPAPVQ